MISVQVRLAEIQGITMEDLDGARGSKYLAQRPAQSDAILGTRPLCSRTGCFADALNNRRIFWPGEQYEATKKRKASVDTLKQLTPAAAGPDEIEIDQLIIVRSQPCLYAHDCPRGHGYVQPISPAETL